MASLDSNGYEFMMELNGFPVVTREFDERGTLESETRLRSARQQTLNPADFEPPAGFTRQQLPGQ
jgi:hypothetical protein